MCPREPSVQFLLLTRFHYHPDMETYLGETTSPDVTTMRSWEFLGIPDGEMNAKHCRDPSNPLASGSIHLCIGLRTSRACGFCKNYVMHLDNASAYLVVRMSRRIWTLSGSSISNCTCCSPTTISTHSAPLPFDLTTIRGVTQT